MDKRADQPASKTTSPPDSVGAAAASDRHHDDSPAAKRSRLGHRSDSKRSAAILATAVSTADKMCTTSPKRTRSGSAVGGVCAASRHCSPTTAASILAGGAATAAASILAGGAATAAAAAMAAASASAASTSAASTTVSTIAAAGAATALPPAATTTVSIPTSASPPSRDGKRANKPLMEKRRRARINQSLALLKTLILDSTKNDNTRHSKLEKADILELTVRYLQRQKILNSDVLDKYKAGFQECTREVTRFLDTPELHLCGDTSKSMKNQVNGSLKTSNSLFIEPAVKQRLLRHLNSCSSEIDLDFSKSDPLQDNQSAPKSPAESSTTPTFSINDISSASRETPSVKSEETGTDTDCSSQKNLQFENKEDSTLSVVQVIPSRLSDGQVVFLLPSHYMQLAGELQKKTSCSKQGAEDSNEPLDFSFKRESCMWRPW